MGQLKTYNTGRITGSADSNGNIAVSTDVPIIGTIHKVSLRRGDARAAGSIEIFESGISFEKVAQLGTSLQTNQSVYPAVFPVDSNGGAAISGAGGTVFKRVVYAPLVIVCSGLGNAGSSFSGLSIYYE